MSRYKVPIKCMNCRYCVYEARLCAFKGIPCLDVGGDSECECGVEYDDPTWELNRSKDGKKEFARRMIVESKEA